MRTKGFQKVSELMGYFFSRIHEIVQQQGKEMMLWCEPDSIGIAATIFSPFDRFHEAGHQLPGTIQD